MQIIKVPSRLWYENVEREIFFPDRWQVDNLTSPGLEKPALSPEKIRERIEDPLDGPTLETLARGKRQAAIVFDDMTRPTPVKDIAPVVLDRLHRAGMKKEQIRFIWALGCHGAYDMIAARKKLGEEIAENYAVYNHDAFQNTVRVGRTPTGVELWFNRGFMACDLKIGIGCVIAHIHVGFGGGAKVVLPGVAGVETINQFHNQQLRDVPRTGLGNFDNNIMRAECDAAGDLTGLNFKVDCLINRRGKIADLYAGSFRATHAKGAAAGKEHYGIPYSAGYDIVVSNSYGKASESNIAMMFPMRMLKPGKQGTAVFIIDCPEDQVPHYAFRSWGSDYGGRQFTPPVKGFIQKLVKKLIVLNPTPDRTSLDVVCHNDEAVVVKTWPEVLNHLEQDYPAEAKVGIVPDATIQYMKRPEA